ncbi:MAG: PEPxxWA-CTERM sorting domain-containing protein [Sandaracinobacteroides sp.]
MASTVLALTVLAPAAWAQPVYQPSLTAVTQFQMQVPPDTFVSVDLPLNNFSGEPGPIASALSGIQDLEGDDRSLFEAFASADIGAVKVSADMASYPLKWADQLAGLPEWDSATNRSKYQDALQTVRSTVETYDYWIPQFSGTITSEYYFDRALSFTLSEDAAVYEELVALHTGTDPYLIGGLELVAELSLSVCGAGCTDLQAASRGTFTRTFNPLPGFYLDETTGQFLPEPRFALGGGFQDSLSIIGSGPDQMVVGPLETGPMHQTVGKFALTFDFVAGEVVTFYSAASCFAQISGALNVVADTRATCMAANSGYWNGITSVVDPDGNPILDYRVTGVSGFDYRYAHPLSPDPAVRAPGPGVPGIPEPASWALMIIGFGLVGTMARRQAVPALAC